jgi:hypothetical protein
MTIPLTDTEVNNRVASVIAATYPPQKETKLLRSYLANPNDVSIKAAFEEYHTFVEDALSEGRAQKLQYAAERELIAYNLANPAVVEQVIETAGVSVTEPTIEQYGNGAV